MRAAQWQALGNGTWAPICRQTVEKPSSVNCAPGVIGNHCSIRAGGVLFGLVEHPGAWCAGSTKP